MKRANPAKIRNLNAIYRIRGGQYRTPREIRLKMDPLYGALETLIVKLGGGKWDIKYKTGGLKLVLSKKFRGKTLAENKKTLVYKKASFALDVMRKIEQNKLTVTDAFNAAEQLWPKRWQTLFPKYLLMLK